MPPTSPAAAAPRPALLGRLPAVAGGATMAVGAVNVASALLPPADDRMRLLLSVASRTEVHTARSLALPLGAALIAAGWQLLRRRRGAATVAVTVLAGLGMVDLFKGLDVEEATLTWMLAAVLWLGRGAFAVRPPARIPARAGALGAAAVTLLAAAALVPGTLATVALSLAGAMTLSAAAALALVPRLPVGGTDDRLRAAALVRAHGADTLSAFKLRSDLQLRFHLGGAAVVGQRTAAGVQLVAGDPVTTPERLGAALAAARDDAHAHGLAFGVVGASEPAADAAVALGLRRMYLGDEAMIATGAMDLSGRRRASLRKAVNRVARTYTAELHRVGSLDGATRRQLVAVSDAWRGDDPERGFSMAHDVLVDDLLPDAMVVLARDADGGIGGFLHFVPVFGRPQASLAFMRRDRSTPNGMTDFLVVRATELLAAEGIAEFSLNFAAFGRWLRAPATRVERLLARVLVVGDRWFQVERLERYNAKFEPRWQPRYLVFERPSALPRVALAAMWAEGQLPGPPRLLARPAPATA